MYAYNATKKGKKFFFFVYAFFIVTLCSAYNVGERGRQYNKKGKKAKEKMG
jgi:hypothetical protein